MSDMLAVLSGAGGSAASQTIAALAGGKSNAKNATAQGEGEDPFMAVLFDRMSALQGQAGQPSGDGQVPDADATGGTQILLDGEELPLKPLDAALLQAQASPADAAIQAALATPLSLGSNLANVPDGQAAHGGHAGAGASDIDPLAGLLADDGVQQGAHQAAAAKPSHGGSASSSTLAAQMAANAKGGAAETAADGQSLPQGQGREQLELPGRQVRANLMQSASASVAQSLAAQAPGAAVETLGATSGGNQAIQVGTLGLGHGVTGMDAQGRPTTGPMQMSIDVPLRSPAFPQELGDRIVWLSTRQGQVADIALNPPHLGPLEVKLSMSGGEAGAQFFSPHPQVREAIEAALPRLREMMAEAGVTLGQAQVRDESLSRQGTSAQGDGRQETGLAGDEGQQDQAGVLTNAIPRRTALGLVDLYA